MSILFYILDKYLQEIFGMKMTNEKKTYSIGRKNKSYYLECIMLALLTAAAFCSFALTALAAGSSPLPESQPSAASKEIAAKISSPEKDFGQQIHFIHIHKLSYTLELFEKGKAAPICTYPCAVAKNPGDKRRAGDNTTPTSWGDVMDSIPEAPPGAPSEKIPFVVDEIVYAADWTHDFGDGRGEIAGAYGPWFISLNTGWDGIGIHGTHDPDSIGKNASEGCIRLRNEDVAQLKDLLSEYADGIGVRVVITED